MNPDYYNSTFYESVMRAASKYHTNVKFTAEPEVLDMLRGDDRPVIDPGPGPDRNTNGPITDEPYDNAQIIREIDYSNFTEEQLNQAIDHLHEVLLLKRKESLLELDLGLE